MADQELRDAADARRFVLHGLVLRRAGGTSPDAVRAALEWVSELVSEGVALPPVGFVADVGLVATGGDRVIQPLPIALAPLAGLLRAYEDHVLGRLFADLSFARAADVLRGLRGRDRARGVAFALERMSQRLAVSGTHVNAAVVRRLTDAQPDELVAETWGEIASGGVDDRVRLAVADLVRAARLAPDALAPEDVFELEHGTALEPLGQRVALRQLLQAEQLLARAMPSQPPRRPPTQREAPTKAYDEDVYPVGGFASIGYRGGVESLLHSQLAYMETDAAAARPDLFDVKFVRGELLYYTRDENQFLRRRRRFRVVLRPELARARFKDPDLPFQRVILTLAGVIVVIRTLARWLSHEALAVELVTPAEGAADELAHERRLLFTVLRREIATGLVLPGREVGGVDDGLARHTLIAGGPSLPAADDSYHLDVDHERPTLVAGRRTFTADTADEPLQAWAGVFSQLLEMWA